MQSAYRVHHSTKTSVTKVELDSGDLTMLTLLDLSALFDTYDHGTLLHRLEKSFGLNGSVLSWFRFYLDALEGSTQSVRCRMSIWRSHCLFAECCRDLFSDLIMPPPRGH